MSIFTDCLPQEECVCTDANVLVVDFGDGETVIFRVKNDGQAVRLEIQPGRDKCPQVLTGEKEIESLTLWNEKDEPDPGDHGGIYWNYKVHPDEAEYAAFVWHNERKEPDASVTNGELMAKAFGEALKSALRNANNATLLADGWDERKPTYIVIGCPSAKKWAESGTRYLKILQQYEKTLDGTGTVAVFGNDDVTFGGITLHKEDIRLVILSEADAAYAGTVCKPRNGEALPDEEYAIVVDMGSSTTDLIITCRGEFLFRDSVALGGTDIDECIAQCLKPEGKTVKDPFAPLKIRRAKEAFFGTMRDKADAGRDTGVYFGNGCEIVLTEELMEKALCDTPVVTFEAEYASWKQGICGFLKNAKEQVAGILPDNAAGHLFLIGGGSNMAECRHWAEEIFGVSAELPEGVPDPGYVIGEGLAYIAWAELKKQEARRTILKSVEELFLRAKPTYIAAIRKGVGDFLTDAYIASALYYRDNYNAIKAILTVETAGEQESFTFREFTEEQVLGALRTETQNSIQYITLGDENKHWIPYVMKEIHEWWESGGISEQLGSMVRQNVEGMFPSSDVFDFQPDIGKAEPCFDGITYHFRPQKLNSLRRFGALTKNLLFTPEDAMEFFTEKDRYPILSRALSSYEGEQNAAFYRSVYKVYDLFAKQVEEQLDGYIDAITPYRLI